ncbi:hypothetical protein QE152_g35958 [Popillia japonica]|uniref:NADH dehydrogenase subunit 3 n=1 Tax=Popillia japonica TaxID=7064 RepID=A0AAW1IEE8_POPJA
MYILVIIHESVHNTYSRSGLKARSLPSINLPGFHEEPTEENSVLRFGSRFNMERSVLIPSMFFLIDMERSVLSMFFFL